MALVLVAGGLLAFLLARDGDSGSSQGGSGGEGVAHVHGLGVDPADGTLLVATHHGVFRIPGEGTAERVGPVQDTMGFTVVGTDHFLGSGHPSQEGIESGQPPLLGLIESTDGAQTWEPVSLSGEVDFHALAFAHGHVYGWDSTSGRLMVSADKTSWETRSTVDLFSFAVDPTDPDHIVATTSEGLSHSTDGGRSWQPVDGGPELLLLAWDADSGLWGVDPAGAVHHTTALDAAWGDVGALAGQPQALLADADTLYAAAADEGGVTGIYRSTDAGATWQLRYRDET